MTKAPLITSVQVTGVQHLVIGWSTGENFYCDLADVISRHSALAPLAASNLFAQVVIEEWGHGLDWPNGLDMGADRLYQLCREQAGLLSPAAFDEWMKKNGFHYLLRRKHWKSASWSINSSNPARRAQMNVLNQSQQIRIPLLAQDQFVAGA